MFSLDYLLQWWVSNYLVMSVLSAWVSEIFNYGSELNTKQFQWEGWGGIFIYVISVQGWNSCVFFQIHFRLLNLWLRVLWVRTLLYWFSNQLLHYFIIVTVIKKDFLKSDILSFYLGNTVKSFRTSVWPFSPHDNTPLGISLPYTQWDFASSLWCHVPSSSQQSSTCSIILLFLLKIQHFSDLGLQTFSCICYQWNLLLVLK